ncbi:MAG: glycosyltransferase [Sedimentisphaerales bacterium]|nr:glycosyltransferase [Sedimentisphaerales bacterium]
MTVLLPTYNRRLYLPAALSSIVRQTYRNLEIFVINDGGPDVADIVRSFHEPRLTFIDRRENRGKPYSLNEALSRAQGKYVAYLDDDDVFYPHHVASLVEVLEGQTDCQVAYSDLYRAHCKVLPDGSRQVLSKQVDVCRDFDRFMMLYFNHVLHVSLMHRRDLLDRTGLYNENLNILIDWDITRRLAFFTDFCHTPTITGEFYSPVGECDRISVQQRKRPEEYLRNVLTIRTTRPRKPWSRLGDLSIIFLCERWDTTVAEVLGRIWRYTFYPYRILIPLPAPAIPRGDVGMPNVGFVPVDPLSSQDERVDVALREAHSEYVAVMPQALHIRDMWLENPLYALIHTARHAEGFLLEGATDQIWGAVLKRADLERARRAHPHLSVEASLTACHIRVRQATGEELPFQFDELIRQARLAEADGNWTTAARLFEYAATHHRNELWMKAMAAKAYFEAGDQTRAGQLSAEVNRTRPTIDTLFMEARIHRQREDFATAIELLSRAEHWLAGQATASVPSTSNLVSSQTGRVGVL